MDKLLGERCALTSAWVWQTTASITTGTRERNSDGWCTGYINR